MGIPDKSLLINTNQHPKAKGDRLPSNLTMLSLIGFILVNKFMKMYLREKLAATLAVDGRWTNGANLYSKAVRVTDLLRLVRG